MKKNKDQLVLDDMIRAMKIERGVHGHVPFGDRDLPYREFCQRYPEIAELDRRWGLSGAAFMILWRYAWWHLHTIKYLRSTLVIAVFIGLVFLVGIS